MTKAFKCYFLLARLQTTTCEITLKNGAKSDPSQMAYDREISGIFIQPLVFSSFSHFYLCFRTHNFHISSMGKVKIAVGVVTLAGGAAGWWWRPIADPMNGDEKGPIRSGWMSKQLLSDSADQSKPLLYELARRVTVFVTVSAARSFLTIGGEFKIKMDAHYSKFLEKVLDRDSGIALITVSNHRSLADDTTIFSSVLPYWMNIQPRYLRYSLCAQEYCFNPKVRRHLMHFLCSYPM